MANTSSWSIPIPSWLNPFYSRGRNGDHIYSVTGQNGWGDNSTNLEMSQNHPILTPALLFMAKLFSQAQFSVVNKTSGKIVKNHSFLNLLQSPNYYQTQNDLFESLLFMQVAQGKSVLYLKKDITFGEAEAMYLLDSDLIEYPENFKTPKMNRTYDKTIDAQIIVYDKEGENLKIKFGDLMFFYDLPNAMNKDNSFETRSRLDGLRQTLINTKDSLLAKNIILKTNGKELITGGNTDGFPLEDDEKAEMESLFQSNYGLSSNRKRGIITKANLTWKSLHIALRDLGLDESVKVDGNLIYTALHIPKDIISLEAKKTTYNNFKESMVSYIQNEMQSTLDAVVSVLQKEIKEPNLKLVGSFSHLPIMQFILIEKFDGLIKKGQALSSLRSAGLPDDVALEECGYKTSITLMPLQQNGNQQQANTQGTETAGNEEENGE